jgi:hypothetical protein
MARCTAPVRGHTGGGAASCPACSSRSRYSGYSRYDSGSYSSPSYSPSSYSSSVSSSGRSIGGGSGRRTKKARWSGVGSAVWYTPEQVLALTPVRENVESLAASQPDLRDVFLCHAWDDRQGSAKELNGLVTVWFRSLVFHYATLASKAKGLMPPRYECRRRAL